MKTLVRIFLEQGSQKNLDENPYENLMRSFMRTLIRTLMRILMRTLMGTQLVSYTFDSHHPESHPQLSVHLESWFNRDQGQGGFPGSLNLRWEEQVKNVGRTSQCHLFLNSQLKLFLWAAVTPRNSTHHRCFSSGLQRSQFYRRLFRHTWEMRTRCMDDIYSSWIIRNPVDYWSCVLQ